MSAVPRSSFQRTQRVWHSVVYPPQSRVWHLFTGEALSAEAADPLISLQCFGKTVRLLAWYQAE